MNSLPLIWHTEKRKVKNLVPWDKNPRKLTPQQKKDLTKSLEKFNLMSIPVVNTDNLIISGHQRLRVMKDLGRTEEEIDVRVPNRPLTKSEISEANIRENKNVGEWDWDLLAGFDKDILADSGFSKDEMERVFQLEVEEDDFDAQKEYGKIAKPITRPGDLYELGVVGGADHRLICGDSTDPEIYSKLMSGRKASLIFTDPPYNVNYDYSNTYGGKGKKIHGGDMVFNDQKTPQEFQEFIRKVFANAFTHSEDNASFYCWHASKNEIQFRTGIEQAGGQISMTLFWLKNNVTFNRGLDYFWIIEPCYFGWKKGKSHYVNKKLANVISMKNIELLDKLTFADLLDTMYEDRDKILNYIHPTQKPVRLAERGIKRHSLPDTIVLEPFCGSGSTLMACEQLGRACRGIELDPKFCDLIIKRWEKFTGKKAKIIARAPDSPTPGSKSKSPAAPLIRNSIKTSLENNHRQSNGDLTKVS